MISNKIIFAEVINEAFNDNLGCQEKNICLFCSKNKRKNKMKRIDLLKLTEGRAIIQSNAMLLENERLLNFLESNEIVYYHNLCKLEYYNRAISVTEDKEFDKEREIYKTAFEMVVTIVNEELIKFRKILYLKNLYREYRLKLNEQINGIPNHIHMGYLEKRLKTWFGDIIVFTKLSTKNQLTILYHSDMDLPDIDTTFHMHMQNNFNYM